MEGESAAALGVEYGGEDAGGVEVGQAQPVDRPIQSHQRDRAAVADDRIVPERRIAAGHRSQLRAHPPRRGRPAVVLLRARRVRILPRVTRRYRAHERARCVRRRDVRNPRLESGGPRASLRAQPGARSRYRSTPGSGCPLAFPSGSHRG